MAIAVKWVNGQPELPQARPASVVQWEWTDGQPGLLAAPTQEPEEDTEDQSIVHSVHGFKF